MKRVVITGATGMIGVTLTNFLISKSIEVLAIIRENSERRNNLTENKNLNIIECNLDNLKNLNLDETKTFDAFFHFGWDGTFGKDRDDINKQKKNIEYTLDAVKLAHKLGCNIFIGAGSQAEYGRVDGLINENTPTNPETEYGKAKLLAGTESKKLAYKLGINHIWTRIFSVYGPYDGENTMIMTSIREMLKGVSPEYTLGEQNWDYLFSEDLAKMLYLLAENGKSNNTYCLASGKTRKLYEFIKIMQNEISPNLELKLGSKGYETNQVMNLFVDIKKLTDDINYTPEIEFEEGIKQTIKWYKENRM